MLWTTQLSDNAADFVLTSNAEALTHYCGASAFAQPRDFYTTSPYQRPSRPQDVTDSIITTSLTSDQLSDSQHLLALVIEYLRARLSLLAQAAIRTRLKGFQTVL
jgi:hypothetical protein